MENLNENLKSIKLTEIQNEMSSFLFVNFWKGKKSVVGRGGGGYGENQIHNFKAVTEPLSKFKFHVI